MSEEYWGTMRGLADEPETDEEETEDDESEEEEEENDNEPKELRRGTEEWFEARNAADDARDAENSQMARLCGLQETDPLQSLLERTWNAIQKGAITLTVLLFLVSGTRADSIVNISGSDLRLGDQTVSFDVILDTTKNVVRHFAISFSGELANAVFTQYPTSTDTFLAWTDGAGDYFMLGEYDYSKQAFPTLNFPAIGLYPPIFAAIQCPNCLETAFTSADGNDIIITDPPDAAVPEPSTLLLLFPLFGLIFIRNPGTSEQDVEVAIKALEIEDEDDKEAIRSFYRRERVQDRDANIKLLKAFLRVGAKIVVFFLISYAFWSVWTERLPK